MEKNINNLEDILKAEDVEEAICQLNDKQLIKYYHEMENIYDLDPEKSWYNNTDPYIYDIYHTMQAEIISRNL